MRPHRVLINAMLLSLMAALGCKSSAQPRTSDGRELPAEGLASFYGAGLHGRPTASGERFDKEALTAAHRTLKFGTCVRVENKANGRSVQVRINDRGPFAGNRVIDVSERAARELEMIQAGVAPARLSACD